MFTEKLKQIESNRWKKIDNITQKIKTNLFNIIENENESAEYLWLSGALVKYNIQRMQLFQKVQKIDMTEEKWSEFANQMEKLENKLIPHIESENIQEIKKSFKMINSLVKLELLHCKSHSLYIKYNKNTPEKKIIIKEKPTIEQKLAKLEILHDKSRALHEKHAPKEIEVPIKQDTIGITNGVFSEYDIYYKMAKETKEYIYNRNLTELHKQYPKKSGGQLKDQAKRMADNQFMEGKIKFDKEYAGEIALRKIL